MTVEQGFAERCMRPPLSIEGRTEGGFTITVDQGHTIGDLTRAIGRSGMRLRHPFDITVDPTKSVIHALTDKSPSQVKYPSALADTVAMTVVLPDGTVTPVRRGQYKALPGGLFQINGLRIPSPEKTDYGVPATDLVDMYGKPFSLGQVTSATINLRPAPPGDLLILPASDASQAKRAIIAFQRQVPRTLEPGGISDLWYIDEEAMRTMRHVLAQQFAAENHVGDVVHPDTLSVTPEVFHPDINARAMIVANVEYAGRPLQNVSPLIHLVRACDQLGIQTTNSLVPDTDNESLLAFLQPYLRPAKRFANT